MKRRGSNARTATVLKLARPERPEPTLPEEVVVDGRRVRIEGADEIVLVCGKASITLRRNGKIVIRGAYVETHSEGTNRIVGAMVKLN